MMPKIVNHETRDDKDELLDAVLEHDREGRSGEDAETLTDTIMALVDGMVLRAISDPKRWPASRRRAQLEAAPLQLVGPSAITQTAKTGAKKDQQCKDRRSRQQGSLT